MSIEQEQNNLGGWRNLGKFWTVANALSFARLLLAVPIVYLILTRTHPDGLTLGLLFIAIATDWFDGKIARWSKTVSNWGKVLDPMADKIGGGAILLAIFCAGLFDGDNPEAKYWFMGIYIARDVIIALIWAYMLRRMDHVYMSQWPGKITVGFLALLAFLALAGLDPQLMTNFLWFGAGLLVYSFLHYAVLTIVEVRKGAPLAKSDQERNQKEHSSN